MKIIDLLNLIAKGEEIPKKIKYGATVFILDYFSTENKEAQYISENYKKVLLEGLSTTMCLNDEVEVMDNEEEKEIEKLDVALLGQCDNWLQDQVTGEKSRLELNPYIINNIRENTLYFQKKINQIIDLINDMRDKE